MSVRLIGVIVAFGGLAACSSGADGGAHVGQGRLALSSDVLADTDVAQVQYTATQVDCASGAALDPPVVETAIEDLVDAFLPGGNPAFEGAPFDPDSEHLFADHFFWLDAGCWDVTMQPLNADGEPSEDCAPATASSVPVADGQVTEILLISQCDSGPAGGLDVIAAFNHAPQISDLTYTPSKFTCEGSVEVCIEASDPDSDPLSIAYASDVRGVRFGRVRVRTADGVTQFCTTIGLDLPGDYLVTAVVSDGQGGTDEVVFPIHVLDPSACIDACECPDGFSVNAAEDGCERITEIPPRLNGFVNEVCTGDKLAGYGAFGARFPDGLTVSNPFFGTGVGLDGRLNAVGVWACSPGGGQAVGVSGRPFNEWIGFSRCLQVPADGEYVVGIAADNQARFRVDGAQVFALLNPLSFDNFRVWWMVPVSLAAGSHIVEMEGLNAGDDAAFGAEIYGPFPVGSTANDAAMAALNYADNIIWSTGDRVAQDFPMGQVSGYTCPDGLAFDVCGPEPLCTAYETAVCE